MWVKIQMGIGNPGKLWTGGDVKEANGKFARVELVEFRSPKSGDCTRRLFVDGIREDAPPGIVVPTLHISTGGVGSLVRGYGVVRDNGGEPTTPNQSDAWLMPLLVWNWSGRVGGYLILDPVAVENGYVSRQDVNSALPGYAWIQTYDGETLSEYVLVKTNQSDPAEGGERPAITSVAKEHVLPIHHVSYSLLSPPEWRSLRAEKLTEVVSAKMAEVPTGKSFELRTGFQKKESSGSFAAEAFSTAEEAMEKFGGKEDQILLLILGEAGDRVAGWIIAWDSFAEGSWASTNVDPISVTIREARW